MCTDPICTCCYTKPAAEARVAELGAALGNVVTAAYRAGEWGRGYEPPEPSTAWKLAQIAAEALSEVPEKGHEAK